MSISRSYHRCTPIDDRRQELEADIADNPVTMRRILQKLIERIDLTSTD